MEQKFVLLMIFFIIFNTTLIYSATQVDNANSKTNLIDIGNLIIFLLILFIISFFIFILKLKEKAYYKKGKEFETNQTNNFNNEDYLMAKNYIKKHKFNYSKIEMESILVNSGISKELIDKIIEEEYNNS